MRVRVELIRENACTNHSSTSRTPPRSGNINPSPGCLPTRRPLTDHFAVLGCRSRKLAGGKAPSPCVQAVTHVASTAVSISGTAGVSFVLGGDALRRRRCAGMFFAKGRATRGKSANFSWNARAMREPGGLERRPTTRARRRTHEDHTTLPRRRATPQTALPRRWPAGWAICPIRSKMHDVQAERARRRLPAPASPWRPPGLHVAATEGSPGA